jgi:CBS domain-containing protein
MKVREMMTENPAYCSPETNLGAAVEIFWNRNCGILPVVDRHGKVVSVITDRDICFALGTRNRLPGDITVGEVATHVAVSCRADEDVRSVLIQMAEAKVRRLPVVDAEGRLKGIVSIDDLVEHADVKADSKGSAVTSEEIINTLKRVYAVNQPRTITKSAVA